MCEHDDLNYIGEQERLYGKPSYSLYNCRKCKSTIVSKKPLQQIIHYQKPFWGSFSNFLRVAIKAPVFSIKS